MPDEKSKKGFAAMDPEKHREIASQGGKAVPNNKRSFATDRELAVRAGKKGGQSVDASKRSFAQDRELAARAGSKGGKACPSDKRGFNNVELARAAGRLGGVASQRKLKEGGG